MTFAKVGKKAWHAGLNVIPMIAEPVPGTEYTPTGLVPLRSKLASQYHRRPLSKWVSWQSRRMSAGVLGGLIRNYGDAPITAAVTGRISGLLVIDVDGGVEDLDFALHHFGNPRIMVETPRGWHLYFAHSAEPTVHGIFGRPIDVLGNGALVSLPGSVVGERGYQFLEGGFEDLKRLWPVTHPEIVPGSWRQGVPRVTSSLTDEHLFNYALSLLSTYRAEIEASRFSGGRCSTPTSFIDQLVALDAGAEGSLGETETRRLAREYWRRATRGQIVPRGSRFLQVSWGRREEDLCREAPWAFAIYIQLLAKFGRGVRFWVSSRNASVYGTHRNRFRDAMRLMAEQRLILRYTPGGRFDQIVQADGSVEVRGRAPTYVIL